MAGWLARLPGLLYEQRHVAALEAYRRHLAEHQRRADLWEQELTGIVEALTALQGRLDAGLSPDDKLAVIDLLVKDIVIETRTDDAGEQYAAAHVTYSFE